MSMSMTGLVLSVTVRNNSPVCLKEHASHQVVTYFAEHLCHLKGARSVHVGSDDGDAMVALSRVAECDGPL